jgi:hypothetical protein
MKKTEKSLVEKNCSKSSKKHKITKENLIYEFELINNIKLCKVTNSIYFVENGCTFNVSVSKGVIEIEKRYEKENNIYYKCLDSKNKYLNIFDNNHYFKEELINDFGEINIEYKNLNDKQDKDKKLSFYNDCLHYLNKIISSFEQGERNIEILGGEIEGKHNDLYVIANTKMYNLLPDFKGGDCVEHIIGRTNTLLHLLNEISKGNIKTFLDFKNEVYDKSKFIKTPSDFNTKVAKAQNSKNYKSSDYIDLLKSYCALSKEDEKTLRNFIDINKINITKKSVIQNIIKNKNYLKQFINETYLKNND